MCNLKVRCSFQDKKVPVTKFLEPLADLGRELLEVFEAILKEGVDSAPIDIQVIVHQNIP